EEIRVPGRDSIDDESLLLIYSRFHNRFQSGFPGKMLNLGCTSAHICYVANGRADAAILANETYQDLAASRVILEAAGGRFYGLDGQEVFLNEYLKGQKIDGPIIVSTPELRHRVVRYLKVI
ncbi:MAG: inositol monophosphatase, partial [Deltaproteobacteria bacterium]